MIKSCITVILSFALIIIAATKAWSQAVVAKIQLGGYPEALAVNATTNKIYVGGDPIAVIDGSTNAVTQLGIDLPAPFGSWPPLAVNEVTNKIYVSCYISNSCSLLVIDGATNNITPVNAGYLNGDVAVNPVTNKIYAGGGFAGAYSSDTVIDGATNNITTITVPLYYGGILVALNPNTNKIYFGGQSGITVIDGATNAVTTLSPEIGANFSGIAVNTVTNKIYAVITGTPAQPASTLLVIDGASDAVTTVGLGNVIIDPNGTIAVNETTNQVYVATSNGVIVIDGATNNTTTLAPGVYFGSIAVNPVNNRIYATDQADNSLWVIGGATNNTTIVGVGPYPYGVAVNSATGRVYVTNVGDNTVTVIDDGSTGTRVSPTAAIVAGSSAMWRQMAQAMAGTPQVNCAWSHADSGDVAVYDTRPNPALSDFGDFWVVWTPGTGGSCSAPASDSQVYAYVSLDSIAGTRCIYAVPQCELTTQISSGTPGSGLLPGVAETALPSIILNSINGSFVNIAASDISPEDSKFATYLAPQSPCAPVGPGTQFVGYGGLLNAPINSSYSTNFVNLVDFSLDGIWDPYKHGPLPLPSQYPLVPAHTGILVGAAPLLVLVNTTNQAPTGFGDPAVRNITRLTLAGYLTGFLGRTADVIPQAFIGLNATYYGTTALIPEFISGDYRVMEHSITNNKEIHRSQESGICTLGSGDSSNPLSLTQSIGSTVSTRRRVVGTREMLSQLASNQDSIGYSFWSTANFANTNNLKYLTVDGVDPLFDTYIDGTLPQNGNGLLAGVSMNHLKDGSYPLWSLLRLITLTNNPKATAAAQNLANAAQNMVSFGPGATYPDFVPYSQLNVFHAHYTTTWDWIQQRTPAANGNGICGPNSASEQGGEAGGITLTTQAGADFCVLKGNYNTTAGVGPTDASSFGVLQ